MLRGLEWIWVSGYTQVDATQHRLCLHPNYTQAATFAVAYHTAVGGLGRAGNSGVASVVLLQ